jgi:hypothetical protein
VPLTTQISRELIHTRTLEMAAHRRTDGLYDVEGHLVDRKPFQYAMPDCLIEANSPIHDMWIRLTLNQAGEVKDAYAVMDAGPHYTCTGVTPNYERLIGLTLGRGWNRAVRERLGGTAGCTHLTEMLAQMATTAMQALWAEDDAQVLESGATPQLDPRVLNACHSYREDGEFVERFFPEHYRASED